VLQGRGPHTFYFHNFLIHLTSSKNNNILLFVQDFLL